MQKENTTLATPAPEKGEWQQVSVDAKGWKLRGTSLKIKNKEGKWITSYSSLKITTPSNKELFFKLNKDNKLVYRNEKFIYAYNPEKMELHFKKA